MYKLGPVHQGILERGCKTGSFSYLLLEAHLAPFCVVIGKHMSNIHVPDFPFSYITESGGKSYLTPAMNLLTVGTVRDQEKWASRDRRRVPDKTDLVNPSIYSPYTVEKMIRGRDFLKKLYDETPKEVEYLNVGGTVLSRLLLKNGAKYYDMTVRRYLYKKLFVRLEAVLKKGLSWPHALEAVRPAQKAYADWVDLGGMLCPREPLAALLDRLEQGTFKSPAEFREALKTLHQNYEEYEWAYAYARFEPQLGIAPGSLTAAKAAEMMEEWRVLSKKIFNMTLADAEKEFEAPSRLGYGLDGGAQEALSDFEAVRGTREANKVLVAMKRQFDSFNQGIDELLGRINQGR